MAITVLDEQLKIGQVKTITSNFGKEVDFTELLFSDTTRAQFRPNDEKTGIVFSVSDNNLDLPEMVCELGRDTVRNLILALKNMYNVLKEGQSDEVKTDAAVEKPSVGSCCRKKIL